MEEKRKEDSFSLKMNCKSRIKSLLDQIRLQNKNVVSYLLIVDQKSLRMISSYIQQTELIELDIFAVQQIEHERKPYQKQHVIYFITPNQESVTNLLLDFPNKKEYYYGYAHIFFTNKISPSLMKQISENPVLMERLKSFKEFNQDFICKFDNIFNFDMPDAFPVLFSHKGVENELMVDTVASKLATVITTLEKFYGIEVIYNREANRISEQLALNVSERLKEIISGLEKDQSQDCLDKTAGKVTLIIVDRSFDPITPLVRDFYYMPMLYDIQDVQNDLVNFEDVNDNGVKEKQRALLSDKNDHIFPKFQYKHIAEVMEELSEEFQEFLKNNTTAKVQTGELGNLDFNTLSDVIKKMPKYKQLVSKYTLHISLIQECMAQYDYKDLNILGDIEQSLATGVGESGQDVKPSKLISLVGARLESEKLNEKDKLRLILLATMCLDITEKDRKYLTQKISIDGQQAMINLQWLGITPQQTSSKKKSNSKGKFDKKFKKQVINKMQSQTLNLCRHTPDLEQLVGDLLKVNDANDCFDNGLPVGKFKSIKINLEDKLGKTFNKKSSNTKKKKLQQLMGGGQEDEEISNSTPKVIIFVAGGISYSEIRAIRNLQNLQENMGLIVGGTSLINPNDYVRGLSSMKSTSSI